MSALALRLPLDTPPARVARPRLVPVQSGSQSLTLGDVVSLTRTALAAGHPAECPVCSGTLVPSRDGGGSCNSCGSTLS